MQNIENTFVFFTVTNKNTLLKYIRAGKKCYKKSPGPGSLSRAYTGGGGMGTLPPPVQVKSLIFMKFQTSMDPRGKKKCHVALPILNPV